MASISEVARVLGTDRDTVKSWTILFAEHLSLTASTPKGEPRTFNEVDLRVLALVAEYWEDNPDFENIQAMLNCGEYNEERFLKFARLHTPLFQQMPKELDDTWQHSVLIGGMAMRNLPQVARAYKMAADALVTEALPQYEPHEIDYPILFLYRHSIELYLKALLNTPPEHHDLNSLIGLLEQQAGTKVAGWIGERVRDFHRIDKMSDVFRYAGAPSYDELCVDLNQLKLVMDRLVVAFESHMTMGTTQIERSS